MSYQLIRTTLEQHAPDLFRALYPRIYRGADQWCAASVPATHYGATLDAWRTGLDVNLYTQMVAITAARLIEYGAPAFHIGRDLAEALARTEAPEDLRWTDISLPFPAGVFLLPRGLVKDTDGKAYDFVGWCRVEAGQTISIPHGRPIAFNNDALIFTTASVDDPRFVGLVKSLDATTWTQARIPTSERDQCLADLRRPPRSERTWRASQDQVQTPIAAGNLVAELDRAQLPARALSPGRNTRRPAVALASRPLATAAVRPWSKRTSSYLDRTGTHRLIEARTPASVDPPAGACTTHNMSGQQLLQRNCSPLHSLSERISMKKQFLSQRAQMAFVGVGMWLLLAFWSLSAFWSHIDQLDESYRNGAKAGAMAGEFALLALVLWHCFNKHIGVRRWSLILGFVLAGVILVHAGALRGLRDAERAQIGTEKRLAQTLTEMSKDQVAGVAEANQKVAAGRSQKERLALANKTNAAQGDIAKAAQDKVASAIVASNERVKAVSILPGWYLDGWCYAVIFILSLAFVGVIFLLMMNREDVDADYDGVPDWLESDEERDRQRIAEARRGREQWEFDRREAERLANQPAPSTDRNYRTMYPDEWQRWQRSESSSRPRVTWRGGRRVDGPPVVEPKDERSH